MLSRLSLACLLLTVLVLSSSAPHAQEALPKQEFRGAWIATVIGLDWPCRLCTSAQQQSELIGIFDGLQSVGVNAVVFQVRTEADAFYASSFEPWSYWLTGSQGTPPDPYYDPLELAIKLAHERGMELHAWLNPYRADRGSDYSKTAGHVTNEHPEWILSFSQTDIEIMNPGLPEVRDRVAAVVGDISLAAMTLTAFTSTTTSIPIQTAHFLESRTRTRRRLLLILVASLTSETGVVTTST